MNFNLEPLENSYFCPLIVLESSLNLHVKILHELWMGLISMQIHARYGKDLMELPAVLSLPDQLERTSHTPIHMIFDL